jgi:heme exporter protein D
MIDPEEFFAMGGYGAYVWGSYASAAIIIGALVIASWRRLARASRALEAEKQGPSK